MTTLVIPNSEGVAHVGLTDDEARLADGLFFPDYSGLGFLTDGTEHLPLVVYPYDELRADCPRCGCPEATWAMIHKVRRTCDDCCLHYALMAIPNMHWHVVSPYINAAKRDLRSTYADVYMDTQRIESIRYEPE